MWIVFVFDICFFTMISCSIDPDQDRYLKKRGMKCGIVPESKIPGMSARVVNG